MCSSWVLCLKPSLRHTITGQYIHHRSPTTVCPCIALMHAGTMLVVTGCSKGSFLEFLCMEVLETMWMAVPSEFTIYYCETSVIGIGLLSALCHSILQDKATVTVRAQLTIGNSTNTRSSFNFIFIRLRTWPLKLCQLQDIQQVLAG